MLFSDTQCWSVLTKVKVHRNTVWTQVWLGEGGWMIVTWMTFPSDKKNNKHCLLLSCNFTIVEGRAYKAGRPGLKSTPYFRPLAIVALTWAPLSRGNRKGGGVLKETHPCADWQKRSRIDLFMYRVFRANLCSTRGAGMTGRMVMMTSGLRWKISIPF